MQIADGRKSVPDVRTEKAESMRKVRDKSSPQRGGETKRPKMTEAEYDADEDLKEIKARAVNQQEEYWQNSLGNLAGDAISMHAYWTRQFGDWGKFKVTSDLVTLAKQATEAWAKLEAELSVRASGAGNVTPQAKPGSFLDERGALVEPDAWADDEDLAPHTSH